jgi:hypothetical protein
MTDGGAAGLLILGVAVGWPLKSPQPGTLSQVLLASSALAYGFDAPTVHWVHGRVGVGFASLGLRAGLPLGGALLGALVAETVAWARGGFFCDYYDECHSRADLGAAIGAALGGAGAIVLDAAVLAYDTPGPARARGVRLAPHLGLGRRATVGLSAQFF